MPGGRFYDVDEGARALMVFVHGNPGWSFEYQAAGPPRGLQQARYGKDRVLHLVLSPTGAGRSDWSLRAAIRSGWRVW